MSAVRWGTKIARANEIENADEHHHRQLGQGEQEVERRHAQPEDGGATGDHDSLEAVSTTNTVPARSSRPGGTAV